MFYFLLPVLPTLVYAKRDVHDTIIFYRDSNIVAGIEILIRSQQEHSQRSSLTPLYSVCECYQNVFASSVDPFASSIHLYQFILLAVFVSRQCLTLPL